MLRGVCFKVKSVGKPDAVAPHVRFDERGWETEQMPPRPSSTLLFFLFPSIRFSAQDLGPEPSISEK
jgi:hypothetical protein